ncbi:MULTISPECIES: class I SAM-dependent methyltransferase family protein [Acidiplasma]|uniref:Methyltransferase n=2 Tax=Acidiplasma TaxID=507753 RepID=A0A0Q0XHY8_9ARCH|nr:MULTISPECIES: class I SAM-dependent methyltransferase family protein [Acidiplasma]KJE49345.1 methyltransferase [Acidiplasma sp. MBA-1]KPV47522.1 methyltransferase [Acidiplasma aeolicum]KQB34266.1 methyltransferase [Acidiplasma aeolicum]WMT54714.1 MAG: class I SAM-dependent methyltransferase family protein [Acidiplasma sp.]
MIHIAVDKEYAQAAIEYCKSSGLFNKKYRVQHDGSMVYIPVIRPPEGYKIVDINPIENNSIKDYNHSFSYDIIGDIAVIKGKKLDEAQKLVDIIKMRKEIKSIYLDSGVTGEYRTRDVKLLYGEDNTGTIYRENGIRLHVDIKRAYFSPRLATERARIANEINENEKIFDMFCGVGPFSVLIAHRIKCDIIASDINCDAIELLNENKRLNSLKGKIEAYCGDSRNLIKSFHDFNRIIMNLPHGAFNFINDAINSVSAGGIINYYEICDYETLESRMEYFRSAGLEIVYKRIVHGFSKFKNMYSIELKKL